jgi:hypothetical protein
MLQFVIQGMMQFVIPAKAGTQSFQKRAGGASAHAAQNGRARAGVLFRCPGSPLSRG